MLVWQSENGKWYLSYDGGAIEFITKMEALEAMAKIDLARTIIWRTQQLIETMDNGPDVLQEYFDGSFSFVDEDVSALGITAAQVTACLTLLENVGKFFAGTTPTNATYRTTVNAVRRVNV